MKRLCAAALLGSVLAFYVGRARCPHCLDSMRRIHVANRDRDLYLDEARRLTLGKSST